MNGLDAFATIHTVFSTQMVSRALDLRPDVAQEMLDDLVAAGKLHAHNQARGELPRIYYRGRVTTPRKAKLGLLFRRS